MKSVQWRKKDFKTIYHLVDKVTSKKKKKCASEGGKITLSRCIRGPWTQIRVPFPMNFFVIIHIRNSTGNTISIISLGIRVTDVLCLSEIKRAPRTYLAPDRTLDLSVLRAEWPTYFQTKAPSRLRRLNLKSCLEFQSFERTFAFKRLATPEKKKPHVILAHPSGFGRQADHRPAFLAFRINRKR